MWRPLRLAAAKIGNSLGLGAAIGGSGWRRRRLLILRYRGVSIDDEHDWRPESFLSRTLFRERMAALRRMDSAVLPFGDALKLMYEGGLPARAVTLTFDNSGHDFYEGTHPILREYGLPATLYLAATGDRPSFDAMLSYLLWKGRSRSLRWPEFLPAPIQLDERGRDDAGYRIRDYVNGNDLPSAGQDQVLAHLAARLDLDYEALCARRILHPLTESEARELAAAGVDFELHTRRVPRGDLFAIELADNQGRIAAVSGRPGAHFCYPPGLRKPWLSHQLRPAGVLSAVTIRAGLAGPRTDRYSLPRITDSSTMTAAEFQAWVSGFASFL